jgi:putative CocE/NonD family hydrolase
MVATNAAAFTRWISHPSVDEYWESFTPTPEEFSRFDIPILTITGYFDGDQPGALQYYKEHMEYGNEEARRMHHLIIGPWDHGGTRANQEKLGGLEFGPNAVVYPDMIQMYVEWFDWVFKDKEKPGFLEKRVAYYVTNRDEWRYADDWNEISNDTELLYLSSDAGMANDVFQSGSLSRTPPGSSQQPDAFTYDPLKLRPKMDPAAVSPEPFLSQELAFDEDILVYHSAPLEEDLEVAGYVRLKAYIELDVPDTDLLVNLYEITAAGTSIDLGNAMVRARYRNSSATPELVVPGEVNLYDIPLYLYFVRTLDEGSRLRLIITSINRPDFEKNYNSGGVVADETAADARTATIKLHHDARYPSALEIPVKR